METTTAQREFVECLDVIQAAIARACRKIRNADRREETQAEALAHAWRRWLSLSVSSHEPRALAAHIGHWAAKSALAGERFAGRNREACPLDERAQCYGRTVVIRFDRPLPWGERVYAEDLRDTRNFSPADLAAFRIDWLAFVQTLSPKQRFLSEALASGRSQTEVADTCGVDRSAITNQKKRLLAAWEAFQGR